MARTEIGTRREALRPAGPEEKRTLFQSVWVQLPSVALLLLALGVLQQWVDLSWTFIAGVGVVGLLGDAIQGLIP